MGGEGSIAYRAMCEALPYALKQSCELLRLFSFDIDLERHQTESEAKKEVKDPETKANKAVGEQRAEEKIARHRAKPFPDDSIISSVLTEVLSMESQQHLQRLDDLQLICDLPLVHSLANSCACNDCKGISTSSPNADRDYWTCGKEKFLWSISHFVADILAISLFESPEMLLISINSNPKNQFEGAIKSIITYGQPAFCHHRDVVAKALKIVGHKASHPEEWIISSYKGQAVYPRVFETGNICQPGFLALYWATGLLFFDGEIYDRGVDPKAVTKEYKPITKKVRRTVTGPLNLYPSMRIEWKVVCRDGYLELYLTCGRSNGYASYILSNITGSPVVSCPHDRALPLHRPDPNSHYTDPFGLADPDRDITETEGECSVIAVDGNSDLRMFAISIFPADIKSRAPFVIRDNACLQCCLNLCREAGYRHVIC